MKRNKDIAGRSKAVYVVGSIMLGIVALLAVYLILMATGVISVAETRIVIATQSMSAEYNGAELTADDWWLEDGALKPGHELVVTVTGSQTDVGKSANTAKVTVVDDNGSDVTNEYDILVKPGELNVAPRKIVVSSAGAEKDYDGNPLTNELCAITGGSLAAGHTIEYFVNGTLTGAGRAPNTFTVAITDEMGVDVTDQYTVDHLYGTLYVHGQVLNIKTASAGKTYDGTPLTAPEGLLAAGTLLENDTLTITVTGSQTEPGECDNTAVVKVISEDGTDVTDMYEPIFDYGKLKVYPISITVQTKDAYKTYDGTPLVCDKWRPYTYETGKDDIWFSSGESFTVGDYKVTATVIATLTDVGTIENTAVVKITDKDGRHTENIVEPVFDFGTLTVSPRELIIQSGSATKNYDGKPLTCGEWKNVSLTPLGDGHKVRVAVVGALSQPGQAENSIAQVLVLDRAENDVTKNYNISLYPGTLIVEGELPSGGGGGGGSGGGGGGGQSSGSNRPSNGDIDDSGNLGGGGGGGQGDDQGELTEKDELVMKIRSNRTGEVYLKYMSYGDYTGKGWKNAPAYSGKIDGSYSLDYLTGLSLASAGQMYYKFDVQYLAVKQYFLPYYMSTELGGYTVQTSDVKYTGSGDSASLFYYAYNFVNDRGAIASKLNLSGGHVSAESSYRRWVYDNYLSVPDDTRAYLEENVISAQGFDEMERNDVIIAVARYLQTGAGLVYNMKYDKSMDATADNVVAFLRDYKTGVCRHYASSATVIFRTLGIPARYTVGYTANINKKDEWTDVTTKTAHAWVEVYIDGMGWIQLEVTGSSPASGNSDSSGPNRFGSEDGEKIKVEPYDLYVKYSDLAPGESLTYQKDTLQFSPALDPEYRYRFTVSGEQSEVGIGKSKIEELVIYDSNNEDVTSKFNIVTDFGKLHVYIKEIRVVTESLERVYDGTPLSSREGEGWEMPSGLLDGHRVRKVDMTGAQTDVGNCANTFRMIIEDEKGADVTYIYKLSGEYGRLTVLPREITVAVGSAVGYYDELGGVPLTCDSFEIQPGPDGGVCEGHTASVTVVGSQSRPGSSANTAGSIKITDDKGREVSKNYKIIVINGRLTVKRNRPVETEGGE